VPLTVPKSRAAESELPAWSGKARAVADSVSL
jgi:hypothetical protein